MNSIFLVILFGALLVLLQSRGADTPFNSGSTGADGPLEIAADRIIDLPPDGILNVTSVNIAQGATVRFRKNALNTPVYILATGSVLIEGTIDVSGTLGAQGLAGEGGPGGFDGGSPAFNFQSSPGDGHGPGGGKGAEFNPVNPSVSTGGGSFATVATIWGKDTRGERYGNALLQPLIGGSGGGGSTGNPGIGGGGGGGAILIASALQIQITGSILAIGGGTTVNPNYGDGVAGGSGGGLRLIAPRVFGTGRIWSTPRSTDHAGFGRIRVDTLDRSGWNFDFRGHLTYGKVMEVFPPIRPALRIIEVAGKAIDIAASSTVSFVLSKDASPNQSIKLQGKGFTGKVPVRVVVTPENGPSASFDSEIDMGTGNPGEVVIPITLNAGQVNRIYAWSR